MKSYSFYFDTLPYRQLNPNNMRRNHWGVHSQVAAIAREEAYLTARNALPPNFKTIQHCEIEEIFTVSNHRVMDIEGQMAACKPWIDGLVDAKVMINDDWQHVHRLSGSFRFDSGKEGTEIRVIEVNGPTISSPSSARHH